VQGVEKVSGMACDRAHGETVHSVNRKQGNGLCGHRVFIRSKNMVGFAAMTLPITPCTVKNWTCYAMRISLTSRPRFPKNMRALLTGIETYRQYWRII
jgi:hypothetical protein